MVHTDQDQIVTEIELQRGNEGLGFNIRGGNDQPYVVGDNGIFVSRVRETGAAFNVSSEKTVKRH